MFVKRLYLGNLPYSATEQDIRDFFLPEFELSKIRIITDKETGRARGFAFAELKDRNKLNDAINARNGQVMGDREIVVNEAKQKPKTDKKSDDKFQKTWE